MAGKRIDDNTRLKIVEAHEKGLSMRKIAKEFGVGSSSVGRIVMEYRKTSKPGMTGQTEKTFTARMDRERMKKIEAIEKRIEELERKILRLYTKTR